MDTAKWQKRLEDYFIKDGIVGYKLLDIIEKEKACGEYFAKTFHGQSVLIDSFQDFFIETITNAFKYVKINGWPKKCDYYAPILMYYVVLFRSFRACENLLLKGYPLDGYALLRDLKDRCIFLAAIAHNITTYPAIQGVKGLDELTLEDKRKKMLNLRKKEENRVMNNMLRSKSGLTSDLIKELKLWEQIFHDEVHGSKMTYFTEMRAWIEDKSPPSIGPMPRDYQLAMYMNRSCEIGWLIVRLLPYLRLKNNAFGDSWSEKQRILDDSFYHMQKGLSNMGKNIGNAFIEFVNKKFKFNDPFIYCEANGKG